MTARRLTVIAALASALLVVAGCGGSGGSGKPSIVLYNGQHQQLTSALVHAFEKQTGIDVRMRTDDGVVLADQILQEGKSTPADVYLTENSPELEELDGHGLLAHLPQSTLSQVPARDSAPTGDWVGVALRVSALVYDPNLVPASQLPASILDLAKPQWKGKVAVAPLDSDFPPVVGALIATEGTARAKAWLEGLKRNASTYQDEESVVSAVNRGDVAAGVVNHYYWYRLRLELGAKGMHSELHYFRAGDPGGIVDISGAAVLSTSRHAQEAEQLVAFMVGKTGQRLIGKGDDFEYPARTGVAANAQLPPYARVSHTTLSVAALGNDGAAVKLIQSVGLGA